MTNETYTDTDTIVDRVIYVETDHGWGGALRLADHTPHGGYAALVDVVDDADVDLDKYSDGDTVGVAALTGDGEAVGFWLPGRKALPIVAEDVDADEPDDTGFNVQFDRSYDIRSERLPISSDAATRAIETAYGWGYDPREMDEGERVGMLIVDADGEYVDAILTA